MLSALTLFIKEIICLVSASFYLFCSMDKCFEYSQEENTYLACLWPWRSWQPQQWACLSLELSVSTHGIGSLRYAYPPHNYSTCHQGGYITLRKEDGTERRHNNKGTITQRLHNTSDRQQCSVQWTWSHCVQCSSHQRLPRHRPDCSRMQRPMPSRDSPSPRRQNT